MEVVDFSTNLTQRPKHLSHLGFMLRLTPEERTAIRTSVDPEIQDVFFLFSNAKHIDLDLDVTIQGVQLLTAKGVFTQERADAILTAPVLEKERP